MSFLPSTESPSLRSLKIAQLLSTALIGLLGAILTGWSTYLFFQNLNFSVENTRQVYGVTDQLEPSQSRYVKWIAFIHYAVFGEVYSTKQPAPNQVSNELRVGASIPIKYLKDYPQLCRINLPAEDDYFSKTPELLLFGGLLSVWVCICLIGHNRSIATD